VEKIVITICEKKIQCYRGDDVNVVDPSCRWRSRINGPHINPSTRGTPSEISLIRRSLRKSEEIHGVMIEG
jgi:hypothetical protein